MRKKRTNVVYLTELALLTAILILMAFTPLGYLRIGVTQITFIVVPVAVGAVLLGPKAGLFLGLVFGISSFMQPESLAMFSIIPLQTIVTTIVPRLFVGLVPAWVYRGLSKVCSKRTVCIAVACILTPLTNTVLYLSFLTIFLRNFLIEQYPTVYGALAGKSVWAFLAVLVASVALNIVLEAASSLIIGTAICQALLRTVNREK